MVGSVVLLLGGLMVAEFTVRSYEARIADAMRPENINTVIVARRDLYPGVIIKEDDLYAVEYPVALTPQGALFAPDQVIGMAPKARILTNEVVRAERLANALEGDGLNAIVPRGMRALSIDIKDGPALAGLLKPGTYVDVMATLDASKPAGRPEDVTILLEQALYVLAVHTRMVMPPMHDDYERPPLERWTVTLAVTPAQAEHLVSAEWNGMLWLTLRNDTDVSFVHGAAIIKSDDVLGNEVVGAD